MSEEKEAAKAPKKSKKEVIDKAFPEGKIIRFKDREEITMIQSVGDLVKGKKVKVHPTTAEQFRTQGIAK